MDFHILLSEYSNILIIFLCYKLLEPQNHAFFLSLYFYFVKGESTGLRDESERPGAIVSNHVSHLDILYHMSSSFPSFVAKVFYVADSDYDICTVHI